MPKIFDFTINLYFFVRKNFANKKKPPRLGGDFLFLALPILLCYNLGIKKILTQKGWVFSMSDYSKNLDDVQILSDDHDLILIEKRPLIPISKKKFFNPVMTFDNSDEKSNFIEKRFITPETFFSSKDKVSNYTWKNRLPIGHDMGIATIRRKTDNFGCIVHLDYEKIINSDDVVTGARLSDFDRCVYGAVVTIFVTGNDTFTTNDILHIISQNPNARLTIVERARIIKSMFHISKFWLSIVTDDSEKMNTWDSFNRNHSFNPERKLYKKLQTSYTGRLLDFRVIGKITFDVAYSLDGQEIIEKETFANVWKLGFPPILYQYAKSKGQISSVPIHFLDTSKQSDKKYAIKRGSHNDELALFLSREIDTMKKTAKRKNFYSHTILLERIYKIDGIDEIKADVNSINKKRKRTRDKLVKILNRFKENGMINGHALHKKIIGKALTFYSVEIFFK